MSVFAEPGLRLAILVPPTLANLGWLTQASRALGHDLTAIVGEINQGHERSRWLSDYRVDIDQLGRYLDQIDAA
jgi:hypothetical protein